MGYRQQDCTAIRDSGDRTEITENKENNYGIMRKTRTPMLVFERSRNL